MTAFHKLSTMSLLVVLGLALVVLSTTHGVDANDSSRCRLEGAWIGGLAGSLVRLTAIPLDPTNQRVSLQLENVTEDPNFGGQVEAVLGIAATSRSDFWGEAVRSGPRTFDFTIVATAINEDVISGTDFLQLYTEVSSGTIEFIDCDTIQRTVHVAFFFPDQDPFADTPFLCNEPVASVAHRVSVVPPCVP